MKQNLFEVDNKEKSRILKLHSNNISEQTVPLSGPNTYASIQQAKETQNKKERIENIAKAWVASQSSADNIAYGGLTWPDYVSKYAIGDEEIAAAKDLAEKNKKQLETQQQRYLNIAAIRDRVDKTTNIIQAPGSSQNGKTWSQYLKDYGVSYDEVQKAVEYANSVKQAQPQAQPQVQAQPQAGGQSKQKITRQAQTWPLKKQMQGDDIKKLQQKLGVKQTGFFWNLTQAAVTNKMKELNRPYDPNKGLTKDDYDAIMGVTSKNVPNTNDTWQHPEMQ